MSLQQPNSQSNSPVPLPLRHNTVFKLGIAVVVFGLGILSSSIWILSVDHTIYSTYFAFASAIFHLTLGTLAAITSTKVQHRILYTKAICVMSIIAPCIFSVVTFTAVAVELTIFDNWCRVNRRTDISPDGLLNRSRCDGKAVSIFVPILFFTIIVTIIDIVLLVTAGRLLGYCRARTARVYYNNNNTNANVAPVIIQL